jgi:hypothetical protein
VAKLDFVECAKVEGRMRRKGKRKGSPLDARRVNKRRKEVNNISQPNIFPNSLTIYPNCDYDSLRHLLQLAS